MAKLVEIVVDDLKLTPQGKSADGQIAQLTARYDELGREEKAAIDRLWMHNDALLASERFRIQQERWRVREQIAALKGAKSADDTTSTSGSTFFGSNF